MKKIIFLLIGGFLLSNFSYGQAVDDRTIVPVAVTLSSILRLNVVSGGNIEFNFNTLADYQNGIANSAEYDTRFTVASSVDWDVEIHAEDATLVSTDDMTSTVGMDLDNIGYHLMMSDGTAPADLNVPSTTGEPAVLTNDAAVLVGYLDTFSNAGDINQNDFTIHWECGTGTGTLMNNESLLEQQLAADRYATNVFLILQPHE